MDADRLRATIAQARAGRAEGFQALLAAYGPRLYGYFLRATGSGHEAEDLLSEMSLRLVRAMGGYEERGRFEPWLFRMAANLLRDRIRRLKARPGRVSISAGGDGGQELTGTLEAKDSPVDEKILAAEKSDRLSAALAKLDDLTREAILLRYFGEMGFSQIADVLQCPLGTVLARVHRGLGKLREIMGDDDGSE